MRKEEEKEEGKNGRKRKEGSGGKGRREGFVDDVGKIEEIKKRGKIGKYIIRK